MKSALSDRLRFHWELDDLGSHWKMLSGSEMRLALRVHCGHVCCLDWRSHLVGWSWSSLSSIKGEAIIQLPTPLGSGFCHSLEPPSQTPSSTITCSCPLASVLNIPNEFKDSFQTMPRFLSLTQTSSEIYIRLLQMSPWGIHLEVSQQPKLNNHRTKLLLLPLNVSSTLSHSNQLPRVHFYV